MQPAYAPPTFHSLRPLLVSIAGELDERWAAIDVERREVDRLRQLGAEGGDLFGRLARLAVHERERRHALEELHALGGVADPGPRTVIRVPGPDGRIASGHWLDATGSWGRAGSCEAA